MQARVVLNFASSALIVLSLFLPWMSFSTGETWSAVRAADPSLWVNASLAISLVAAGGIILLLSRYGGLLTMIGVGLFVAHPPGLFFPGAPDNFVIRSSFDTGVWFAWAVATVSLLGSSWTLPFALRDKSERRILAMGFFPAGVIVLVFGLLLSPILSLVGLVVTGTSLAVLLSLEESERFGVIRKIAAIIRSVRHRVLVEPTKAE